MAEELPPFRRTTGFANWNRYAAVNDEFIDIHMDAAAARAAGQPDVFGMGNLRIGYQHAALHEWLEGRGDGPGDIAAFGCQFRALNFLGDELTVWGRVTGSDGDTVEFELGVTNQHGEETTPATATVMLSGSNPSLPSPPTTPTREPGELLDAGTIAWLGRPLPPLRSLPVGANDIRRWAQAIWWPESPPATFLAADAAPRDFNPYAWNPEFRPDAYPWMRGVSAEPGRRPLNGGQRNWYGVPIRPGDVLSSEVTLVDAFEKEGKLGRMLFLVDEARWTNQDGDGVRVSQRTTIYY